MRSCVVPVLVLATACIGLQGQTQERCPTATRLEPNIARPGTVVTITGVAMGKSKVDEVFLTDHRFDLKVKVLEQTETTLKIRVPPFARAGRHQLLFLTKGTDPAYLEQPVFVLVELEDDLVPNTVRSARQ